MSERSTQPMRIEGAETNLLWQQTSLEWIYDEPSAIGTWSDTPEPIPNSPNDDVQPTSAPQLLSSPDPTAVLLGARDYGKRALQTTREWEAVVEAVGRDSFHCRIVEVRHGTADSEAIELTEFSYGDLANEDDRTHIVPGAVLYWTIGKSRNSAGTVTNASLLRVRRLPTTSATKKEAARRAEQLLQRLLNNQSP